MFQQLARQVGIVSNYQLKSAMESTSEETPRSILLISVALIFNRVCRSNLIFIRLIFLIYCYFYYFHVLAEIETQPSPRLLWRLAVSECSFPCRWRCRRFGIGTPDDQEQIRAFVDLRIKQAHAHWNVHGGMHAQPACANRSMHASYGEDAQFT